MKSMRIRLNRLQPVSRFCQAAPEPASAVTSGLFPEGKYRINTLPVGQQIPTKNLVPSSGHKSCLLLNVPIWYTSPNAIFAACSAIATTMPVNTSPVNASNMARIFDRPCAGLKSP